MKKEHKTKALNIADVGKLAIEQQAKIKMLSSDIGKALSKIGDLERELKKLKNENSVLKKLVR